MPPEVALSLLRHIVPLDARRYVGADVALLAEVDRAMETLSGPATVCVLKRPRDVYGDARFECLGSNPVGHLYNLRNSAPYLARPVALTKTRPTRAITIGVRKAPAPEGRPGFIRIDSVHQGDQDGIKGLYHINAVNCVTQWHVVATRRLSVAPVDRLCQARSPALGDASARFCQPGSGTIL